MHILDILLLPRKVYRKLTGGMVSLYVGIILLGIVNMFVPLWENYKRFFYTGHLWAGIYNILLAILMVVLVGVIDVVFFSFPMFDLVKFFKKDFKFQPDSRIKFMKVYILANLLILPVSVLFYFLSSATDYDAHIYLAYFSLLAALGIMVWLSATITRGINALFDINGKLGRLVFFAVFMWSYILVFVYDFIMDTWMLPLFK